MRAEIDSAQSKNSSLGVKPDMNMMYASSKPNLVQTLQVAGKVFDVRKRDELNEEFLLEKLSFFK